MYGEKLGKDADMGDYIKDFQRVRSTLKVNQKKNVKIWQ